MKEIDAFRKIISAANRDQPPGVDVVDAVMLRIRRRETAPTVFLWAVTAVSSAAAAVLAVLAVQAWRVWLDPVTELFSLCQAVMQ